MVPEAGQCWASADSKISGLGAEPARPPGVPQGRGLAGEGWDAARAAERGQLGGSPCLGTGSVGFRPWLWHPRLPVGGQFSSGRVEWGQPAPKNPRGGAVGPECPTAVPSAPPSAQVGVLAGREVLGGQGGLGHPPPPGSRTGGGNAVEDTGVPERGPSQGEGVRGGADGLGTPSGTH